MPRGRNHKQLFSLSQFHGEQVWLMLVETGEGGFVLEDIFGEWSGQPDVIESGAWPPHGTIFTTRPAALRRAAEIIAPRYGITPEEWLGESKKDD